MGKIETTLAEGQSQSTAPQKTDGQIAVSKGAAIAGRAAAGAALGGTAGKIIGGSAMGTGAGIILTPSQIGCDPKHEKCAKQ